MKVDKIVTITKVVSRIFIADIVAKIQHFLGMNLKSYEKMVDKGVKQIKEEIEEKGYEFKWFRFENSELTNGAMSITLYGELK